MISLKGKKILVVDDEPGYREVLCDEFRMYDADVFEAENGVVAFDFVQKQQVDLIISDIRMAGGNGVDLLDKVKAVNINTPVVMLITGFSDIPLEDVYAKGAEAIFSKPFDPDEMIATVHKSLLSSKERYARRFERLASDFLVEMEIESFGTLIHGSVINIGRGGMFVAFGGPMPEKNARVFFCIKTKADSSFSGIGLCRWFRDEAIADFPRGMGIEFQDLTEDSVDILLELLKGLEPLAFIPRDLK